MDEGTEEISISKEGEVVIEANLMNFKNLEQWAGVYPPRIQTCRKARFLSLRKRKCLMLFSWLYQLLSNLGQSLHLILFLHMRSEYS